MVEAITNSSEKDWQKIFDSISDLIYVIDKDYRLVRANKAVSDFFKVPREELLGKRCYELVHKLDHPWPTCPAEKTFIDKLPHIEEVNDPNIGVPLLVSTFPVLDAKGDLTGIIHIAKDIHERKKTEAELQEQNVLINSIINSQKDTLIFALDKKYCYTVFNENHRQEMKKVYNANIEIGGCMLDYINVPEVKLLAKASYDRVLNGESFTEVQKQPNLDIWYEFNWNPVKSAQDEILGISVFVTDITERKQMEDELRKKMAILEKFHKITVGRELKMKELKARIAQLEAKLGERHGPETV
jgi:PAS domain S-box-containing protein